MRTDAPPPSNCNLFGVSAQGREGLLSKSVRASNFTVKQPAKPALPDKHTDQHTVAVDVNFTVLFSMFGIFPSSKPTPLRSDRAKRDNKNFASCVAGAEALRSVQKQMLKVIVLVSESVMCLIVAVENGTSKLRCIVCFVIFADIEIINYFHT